MLESLMLRNFQTHEKFKVEFDPLVTCIVGISDAGKSTVLRALRWACQNRPSGEAFRKHGTDSVSTVLKVDGRKVARKRGKDGNTYSLDGKEFKAFGSDVPAEIAALLNVDDLTFQSQLDPPYWFLKSPGEVSRELNDIVDLSLIDSVLSAVASELRDARSEAKLTESRLREAEERGAKLVWVEEAEATLTELERSEKELNDRTSKTLKLAAIVSEGEKLRSELQNAGKTILEAGKGIRSIEDKERKLSEGEEREQRLNELLNEIEEAEKERDHAHLLRAEAEQRFQELAEGTCPLCGRENDG